MKFVDGDGVPVSNMIDLEPWEHSVLAESTGVAHPITKITYGYNVFSVEWTTDPEFEWRL